METQRGKGENRNVEPANSLRFCHDIINNIASARQASQFLVLVSLAVMVVLQSAPSNPSLPILFSARVPNISVRSRPVTRVELGSIPSEFWKQSLR
jgi:hypothetical protein